jgi:outer membrane protein assembly factor BamE (lipoprotein component of BamABCDE complex)
VLVALAGVLAIVLLRGGLGGSNHRLTRDNFEKVTKEMPDREVVRILGKPTRAEGTFGQRISWDQIEGLKTLVWESGSTKIVVVCTGGAVNHMTGTFKDGEIKPATWTEANFDKLNWNQSRAEVRALLGPPVEISGGAVIGFTPAVSYVWKDGSKEISAMFEGDRLYSALGNFNGKLVQVRSRPNEVPDAKLPVGPSKLTEENFRKIKPNMTLDQVCAILGPPQVEGGGGFSVTWLDKHNNNVQILFQNKKVALASAFINGKHLDALAAPEWVPPPGVPPADH